MFGMCVFRKCAFFLAVVAASGSLSGAPECPCITNSSALHSVYQSALVAAGFPPDYGLTGCGAHDSNLSNFGCAQNEAQFCLNPWCYVDMDLCPENKELCEAAGGVLGSDVSPHCFSRKSNPTTVGSLNLSEHYSYETCGSVNTYDTSELLEPVSGRIIRAAAAAWAPWMITKTNLRGEVVWGGPSYDFFEEALELFNPKPTINIIPGWATAASREKFPTSSYTACVHDVAVGNFDICLADLWLTPQRNQLVTFLPAIRQDFFYLVVKQKESSSEEVSLWARLQRPFLPFTAGAWMSVVGFLIIMAVLLWLRQLCETGCEGNCKTAFINNVSALLRSAFFVFHDFLLGQSSMDVEGGPVRQLFSLGLAFFILITLASYTASLASMLVVEKSAAGEVASIHDAIQQGMAICAPTSLLETFTSVYPRANFVGVDIDSAPRSLHAGRCQAMVLSQDVINRLFAGKVHEADCDAVRAGSIDAAEGQCGAADRDCSFIRVGDLLWSVPLSFPISDRMAHSLSWAFTFAITQGVMEEAKQMNSELFAQSICEVEAVTEEALSFEDLSGSMVIAFAIVLLGFVVMAVRHFHRQRRSSEGGSDAGEGPQDPPPTEATAEKKVDKGTV